MIDLNIDENFELTVKNGKETTDYSFLLQTEEYLRNLIIRNELHFSTDVFFETIFDLRLYPGLSDTEIELQIENKILTFYENQFPQVRDYLLVEALINGPELTIFYVNKKSQKLLFETETGNPFVVRI